MGSSANNLAFGILVAILFSFPAAGWAQEKDPGIGTWKMNLAKSKFNPGPPPKSVITRFEADGKGLKNTTDIANAAGESTTSVYTANFDGRDYPMKGSPTVDAVSLRKLAPNKVERVDKKGGKVVQTLVRTISADGKTMTVTQDGTNAKGEKFSNVYVFERQ